MVTILGILIAAGAGCVWIGGEEVTTWEARATCAGGSEHEGAEGCTDWLYDADGDGHGLPGAERSCLCSPVAPFTATSEDDCDDSMAGVHPGAVEVCDLVDQDCDGTEDGAISVLGVENAFPTIQEAITAAGVGGTVSVCSGTYSERLEIDSDLTIDAPWGPEFTLVSGVGSGGDDGAVVAVTGGRVSIEGLTITGGTGDVCEDDPEHHCGGGVMAGLGVGSLTLRSCVIRDNTLAAGDGGGVYSAAALLVLEDCSIEGNISLTEGGGIYVGAGAVSIDGGTLAYNFSDVGGGLAFEGESAQLVDVRMLGNFAALGGGVYFAGEATADGGDWSGNLATGYGGAVYLAAGSNVVMTEVAISDNAAESGAGGIHLDGGALRSVGSTFPVHGTPESNTGDLSIPVGAVMCIAAEGTIFQCSRTACTVEAGDLEDCP